MFPTTTITNLEQERVERVEWTSRAFDIAAAAVLLIVAVPLIVIFAVALAVSLRAWPFFSQTRIGLNGREFKFLKLRTLPPSAPVYASKYEIARVKRPKVAQFLRATHLDELPQLFLVLAGKMSVVGPRPEMPYLHETFDRSHRMARESLRPGCAGIWQTSVDNDRLIMEAPEYDLFYAEQASVRLDLWILWRTGVMMAGGRKVSLADVPRWALTGPVTAPALLDVAMEPGLAA